MKSVTSLTLPSTDLSGIQLSLKYVYNFGQCHIFVQYSKYVYQVIVGRPVLIYETTWLSMEHYLVKYVIVFVLGSVFIDTKNLIKLTFEPN